MLRRVAGALGVTVLLVAGSASAQVQPTARQLDLARRYIAALQMERSFAGMGETLLPALFGTAGSSAEERKRAEFYAIMRDINVELIGELSVRMAPVLAETFSEKELEDVVAFYEGPTGRAIIEKTPQLTAKMAPILGEIMPKTQAKIIERLCKDGSCRRRP